MLQITPNQQLNVQISNSQNHENNLFFPLGPFSKQMDEYKFLDLDSSESGKPCLQLGYQVKFISFTLPLMCAFEDLSKIKYLPFSMKSKSLQL